MFFSLIIDILCSLLQITSNKQTVRKIIEVINKIHLNTPLRNMSCYIDHIFQNLPTCVNYVTR